MDKKYCQKKLFSNTIAITSGTTYLDIDAYACIVAMSELLNLKGEKAIAYSRASGNYSVCKSLIKDGQVMTELPSEYQADTVKYIIVDVSDPEFIKDAVPLDNVIKVYDHHVGFEQYWSERIGDNSHIEFIGAAATLIYREWKKSALQNRMTRSTALLMIAAILDNTLNLTSSNTTDEDIEAFRALCRHASVSEEFRAMYFSEVQKSVEADLKSALFGDIKTIQDNAVLPPRVAQLCVWNADSVLARLDEIRGWFAGSAESFMINLIDLSSSCSYFVCDDERFQKKIETVFEVRFEAGIARTANMYLRKQIIRTTLNSIKN